MTHTGTASDSSASARWTVVGLVAAALFINYVDRGAVPTAAPLIQDDLGLSPQQLGLLMSAFWWLYAVLQFPVGWLVERFGASRLLSAGLAVWACATMLVGVVHSFAALLGLRLLLGIGESVGFPSMSKLLATVVPLKSMGLANGIVAFGYLSGPAVGTLVGGLLMASYGWRSAFWVFGALSLLWLVPWSRVRLPPQPVAVRGGVDQPLRALLKRRELWGTSLGLPGARGDGTRRGVAHRPRGRTPRARQSRLQGGHGQHPRRLRGVHGLHCVGARTVGAGGDLR